MQIIKWKLFFLDLLKQLTDSRRFICVKYNNRLASHCTCFVARACLLARWTDDRRAGCIDAMEANLLSSRSLSSV